MSGIREARAVFDGTTATVDLDGLRRTFSGATWQADTFELCQSSAMETGDELHVHTTDQNGVATILIVEPTGAIYPQGHREIMIREARSLPAPTTPAVPSHTAPVSNTVSPQTDVAGIASPVPIPATSTPQPGPEQMMPVSAALEVAAELEAELNATQAKNKALEAQLSLVQKSADEALEQVASLSSVVVDAGVNQEAGLAAAEAEATQARAAADALLAEKQQAEEKLAEATRERDQALQSAAAAVAAAAAREVQASDSGRRAQQGNDALDLTALVQEAVQEAMQGATAELTVATDAAVAAASAAAREALATRAARDNAQMRLENVPPGESDLVLASVREAAARAEASAARAGIHEEQARQQAEKRIQQAQALTASIPLVMAAAGDELEDLMRQAHENLTATEQAKNTALEHAAGASDRPVSQWIPSTMPSKYTSQITVFKDPDSGKTTVFESRRPKVSQRKKVLTGVGQCLVFAAIVVGSWWYLNQEGLLGKNAGAISSATFNQPTSTTPVAGVPSAGTGAAVSDIPGDLGLTFSNTTPGMVLKLEVTDVDGATHTDTETAHGPTVTLAVHGLPAGQATYRIIRDNQELYTGSATIQG